jgi:hypothetical protein
VKNIRKKPAFVILLIAYITSYFILLSLAGCRGGDPQAPLKNEIDLLKRDKTKLTAELQEFKEENQTLRRQISNLSGLPENVRFNPYELLSIKITSYTNIYDKDDDGIKETLEVHLQPIDKQGDVFKAAGDVKIEIWNLNNPAAQALLGSSEIKADDLKNMWYNAFFSSNYRIDFDVSDKIDLFTVPLTIKVTLTDYLTGKIFTDQRMIEPN